MKYNPDEFKKNKEPIMSVVNKELGYVFVAIFILFLILLLAAGIKWVVNYLI